MAAPKNAISGTAAYLHYLRLASEIKSRPSSPAISPDDEALLEALALHWKNGKPLAVIEAMQLVALGSPATLNRRMVRLRKLDLIETQSSPKNSIIKLLAPTKRAMAYFAGLGGAVAKAVKSAAKT